MTGFLKGVAKVLLGRSTIVDIAPPVHFVGWKLATGSIPPWGDGGNNVLASDFVASDNELAHHINKRNVILTQFRQASVSPEVEQLRWRHYFVHWSATVASAITCDTARNFVEIGVCDGLTAWYASKARQRSACGGEFFLYDAWDGMRSDLLSESERNSVDSYSYLDIENTKRNLGFCGDDQFVYVKGYVPESFAKSRCPDRVAWVHIDLNSSIPTIASLDFFWDRLLLGGIVLLDDFAFPGYEDTRAAVERWCQTQDIGILQLPTGQAIIVKQK